MWGRIGKRKAEEVRLCFKQVQLSIVSPEFYKQIAEAFDLSYVISLPNAVINIGVYWLHDRDSERTKLSKTISEVIYWNYRRYNKKKILCRGEFQRYCS